MSKMNREHKEKIRKSLKKYYSREENKEILVKNLNKARDSRTKDIFRKQGETHSQNMKLGISKTRKGQNI